MKALGNTHTHTCGHSAYHIIAEKFSQMTEQLKLAVGCEGGEQGKRRLSVPGLSCVAPDNTPSARALRGKQTSAGRIERDRDRRCHR